MNYKTSTTVGQVTSPSKDVQVLTHGTREYVVLRGRRNFADVIHLRILRWRVSTNRATQAPPDFFFTRLDDLEQVT